LRRDWKSGVTHLLLGLLSLTGWRMVEHGLPVQKPFLVGYGAKVRQDCDLPELIRWSGEILAGRQAALEGQWPPLPLTLGLGRIRFLSAVPATMMREGHLKFSSGGHFTGFWGLRVGDASLRCDPSPWELRMAEGVCAFWQDEGEFGLSN
jgi:hypothetical protein